MESKSPKLKLSKVIKGRENWKNRAKKYQFEKRKAQDKIRYLEIKLNNKDEKIYNLNKEIDILKKNQNQ
jgi:hypothetical protein